MNNYRPNTSRKRPRKTSTQRHNQDINNASDFYFNNNTTNTPANDDGDFEPYVDDDPCFGVAKLAKYDPTIDIDNIYDPGQKQTQKLTQTLPNPFTSSASSSTASSSTSSASSSNPATSSTFFPGLSAAQKKQVRTHQNQQQARRSLGMGETARTRTSTGRDSELLGVRNAALTEARKHVRVGERMMSASESATAKAGSGWDAFTQMTSLIGGGLSNREEFKKLFCVVRECASRVCGRLWGRGEFGCVVLQFDVTNFKISEPCVVDTAEGRLRGSHSMARNAPLQTCVLDYVYPVNLTSPHLTSSNHNLTSVSKKWARIPIPQPMQNLARCKSVVPGGKGCPEKEEVEDDDGEERQQLVEYGSEGGIQGGEYEVQAANWAAFVGVMSVTLDCVKELWQEAKKSKTENSNSTTNLNSNQKSPLVIHVVSDWCNTQKLSLFWLVEQFNKYNCVMVVDACQSHHLSGSVDTLAKHLCGFGGLSKYDLETCLWSEGALNKYRYSEVCEIVKKAIPGFINVICHLEGEVLSQQQSDALDDWRFYTDRAARAWSGEEHQKWLKALRQVVFLGRGSRVQEEGEQELKELHVHLDMSDIDDDPEDAECQRRAESKARYVIYGFSARYYS